MPDVQEVFRMATQKVRPDPGAMERQGRTQRRRSRNRKFGALAIAAAIGMAAVVVVIRALDEGTGTQPGGQPTPTATQPIPSLPGGTVEPGRYVFTTFDPDLDASYRVSIDVAERYQGLGGWAAIKLGTDQTGVATVANIGNVYADACRWDGSGLGRSAVSSTDELVAALASQKGLRVSAPTDVTLDGFAGTYVERSVPARTEISDCDGGEFRVYRYTDGGWRALIPDQVTLLWVLDVDGDSLVIEASLEPGTSAQVRTEMVEMVESIQIDPLTG